MNQVRVGFGFGSVEFGSGELRVKLTWIGLYTGRVKISFDRFWLWVWVNIGSGRNRIGLNSK